MQSVNEIEAIAEQHYSNMYDDYNKESEEDEICNECTVCGENKILDDEKCCDKCKGVLKRQFSNLLHANFNKEEIEVLNEIFDGEEIK